MRSRLTNFNFDNSFNSTSYRNTSNSNGKYNRAVLRPLLKEDPDSDTTFEIGSNRSLNRYTINKENGLDSNAIKALYKVLRNLPPS